MEIPKVKNIDGKATEQKMTEKKMSEQSGHSRGSNHPLSEQERKDLETTQSMSKMVFEQFKEHKLAVGGALIIGFFVLIALFADVISMATGLDPNDQNVTARYLLPMTRSAASSDAREVATENWVQANPDLAARVAQEAVELNLVPGAGAEDILYDLMVMDVMEAREKISLLSKEAQTALRPLTRGASTFHVFGTDEVGRDILIRLIYGTRVSLGVGVLVALASALVGLLIGSMAGFYGGWVDTLLMRVTDALLSLPLIPVLIVFAAIDLRKLPLFESILSVGNESIFKMVVILCLFSWMQVARLVRGSILSLREREFVLASKTLGARDGTIIVRHMFPNVIAPMLVSISLGVGDSILFEAALSFLGLGIMPPTASWGNMLNNAQEVIYQNVWLTILPGLLILFTVISFNFVGDGLQDAVDPKSVRR